MPVQFPTLLICTPHLPCQVLYDARPVAVLHAGQDAAALPLPTSGQGVLTLAPLLSGPARCPLNLLVTTSRGEVHLPLGGEEQPVHLSRWPDGLWELIAEPPLLAPPPALPVPVDVLEREGLRATLYQDQGLRLSLEQEGRPALDVPVTYGEDQGRLSLMDSAAGPLILARGPGRDGGEYLLAVHAQSAQVYLDTWFHQIRLAGEGALLRRTLPDTVGHQLAERWVFQPGRPPECAQRGYVVSGSAPQTPEDTASALAEAAALGLWDEAAGYLAAGAAGLQAARDMLGAFDEVVAPRHLPVDLPAGVPVALLSVQEPWLSQVRIVCMQVIPQSDAAGPYKVAGIAG